MNVSTESEDDHSERILTFIRGLRECLERKDWTVADYDAALAAQAELGLTDGDLSDDVLEVVQDVRDMRVAIKRDVARIETRFGVGRKLDALRRIGKAILFVGTIGMKVSHASV